MKLPALPKLPSRPPVSPKRVFYSQPSGVKVDLVPLYQRVAKALDVKPEAVRAFAVVESDEKPFTEHGFPVVRFEAAYWRKFRVASREAMRFDTAKNLKDLDGRWAQFEDMWRVNETAAIMSHSFGVFQTMGFNFKLCLCADPQTFLTEMRTVEGQFKLFERFVKSSPALYSAIKLNRADQVGVHYNGPAYRKNKYDVKWAAATKAGGTSVWA